MVEILVEYEFSIFERRLDNCLKMIKESQKGSWAEWYWTKVFNELHRRMNTMFRSKDG